ncbi:hypothetical protein [Sporomusa acidovorans]|uniref:Uncharacterized protein n=1 Tax=Sporomusa acidovorans (strain ATCC 49682 / DSM 3132 / Mol) TaxID=1123286 RepID=A0ABZ3J5Q5_SPOA4|nr:hypothetical protein [Sporomusa acidovorans]OZC19497.1 hypothetical protein SPACI_28210 [Sporomusa acidovorans DSM 3132]SDF75190.1 hypothetical protein SAMN04488499_10776 [Sporomusa acidovorans]
MKHGSRIGIIVVGFIITDQFYTAVNFRMLVIAACILVLVWSDFKRLLIKQYVRLVRAIRFLFTPSKHF